MIVHHMNINTKIAHKYIIKENIKNVVKISFNSNGDRVIILGLNK
jgi:hypothetical protein